MVPAFAPAHDAGGSWAPTLYHGKRQIPWSSESPSESPSTSSRGDNGEMLRALLACAPGFPACVWLSEEAAVQATSRAGIGARLRLSLGGAHDPAHHRTLTAGAEVRSLSDGDFGMRDFQYTGLPADMSPPPSSGWTPAPFWYRAWARST